MNSAQGSKRQKMKAQRIQKNIFKTGPEDEFMSTESSKSIQ